MINITDIFLNRKMGCWWNRDRSIFHFSYNWAGYAESLASFIEIRDPLKGLLLGEFLELQRRVRASDKEWDY